LRLSSAGIRSLRCYVNVKSQFAIAERLNLRCSISFRPSR